MTAPVGIKGVGKSVVHPMDIHVGFRLRQRREALYLTQLELGGLLALTCQQIQKYECGLNRISASRLFELSRILTVHINYFFEQTSPDCVTTSHLAAVSIAKRLGLLNSIDTEISELIDLFSSIKSPSHRKRVLALMRTMENSAGDYQIPLV